METVSENSVEDCCSFETTKVTSASLPFLCYWDGILGLGHPHYQFPAFPVLSGEMFSVVGHLEELFSSLEKINRTIFCLMNLAKTLWRNVFVKILALTWFLLGA